MERKIIKRNIATSIILQLTTIISGFIIPKIILTKFGSNINGLVASINQFLSYISLLEGGLGGVIRAALYKPLKDNDFIAVSSILKTAELFFKKIAMIYVIYVTALIVFYPRFVQTGISTTYCSVLILVLASNLFIQYFFSITYKVLLTADRKLYVISLTQIIVVLMNLISVILCSKFFDNIIAIKLLSAIVFLIQPVVYRKYVKKHYSINNKITEVDESAISQRWDGLAVHIAAFIHNNTDIAILTIFSSLANVSVYSVYAMVIGAIKSILISVSSSIESSFGRVLASNNVKLSNTFFDKYTFLISSCVTVLFTCTIVLITPFVRIYTEGIEDADYNQLLFAVVFVVAEMIYCFRDPYINVAYACGLYKAISKQAILEALINILLSLILVRKIGIIGVAIGTAVAMLYRMIDQVFFVSRNVLFRPIWKFIKSILVFGGISMITVLITYWFVDLTCDSYFKWIICATEVFAICVFVLSIVCIVFYGSEVKQILGNEIKKSKHE